MCVCVLVSNLVEDKSLADVAPAGGGTEVVNQQEQQQHEGDAGRGDDGVDEEHHDSAANDTQHTRVPGEVPESGSGKKGNKWRSHLVTPSSAATCLNFVPVIHELGHHSPLHFMNFLSPQIFIYC